MLTVFLTSAGSGPSTDVAGSAFIAKLSDDGKVSFVSKDNVPVRFPSIAAARETADKLVEKAIKAGAKDLVKGYGHTTAKVAVDGDSLTL